MAPQQTCQAMRALIREVATTPEVTLKGLQIFTAEIGVSVHEVALIPHTFYGTVVRKKPCLKESIILKKTSWSL